MDPLGSAHALLGLLHALRPMHASSRERVVAGPVGARRHGRTLAGSGPSPGGCGRRGEAARIQELPDSVERLTRITQGEPPQLEVDAVARAEEDAIVADQGVETIERSRWG